MAQSLGGLLSQDSRQAGPGRHLRRGRTAGEGVSRGERSPQAMTELPTDALAAKRPLPAWLRLLYSGENHLLALVLAATMVVPLAEVVLRKFSHFGIMGAS